MLHSRSNVLCGQNGRSRLAHLAKCHVPRPRIRGIGCIAETLIPRSVCSFLATHPGTQGTLPSLPRTSLPRRAPSAWQQPAGSRPPAPVPLLRRCIPCSCLISDFGGLGQTFASLMAMTQSTAFGTSVQPSHLLAVPAILPLPLPLATPLSRQRRDLADHLQHRNLFPPYAHASFGVA